MKAPLLPRGRTPVTLTVEEPRKFCVLFHLFHCTHRRFYNKLLKLESSFNLVLKVLQQFWTKKVQLGGKQPSGLFLASISILLSEQVPFAENDLVVSNIVSDSKHILVGLYNGGLYSISWKGEFYGTFELDPFPRNGSEVIPSPHSLDNGVASKGVPGTICISWKSAIIQLELCFPLRLLFVLYSDGQLVSCSTSKKGLKHVESIKAEKRLAVGDAVCASVASKQQILAVGTKRGLVKLYDLAESASLIRSVSLYDWGYSMEDTGPVSCIAWTPDNSAFAVGWKLRGLTVWSVSGCRLMSTIRQIGLSSVSSPMVKPIHECKYEPLMTGTSLMQWDEYGYRLYAIEERSLERVLAFSFGKCCLNRGVSGMTYVRQVIYGDDRLLVVQSEDTDELKMLHLNLPVSYISQNWPVQHVAVSKDGMYLAVAGLHGGEVFGDITQEQKFRCKGLLWMGKIVVVCNYIDSSNTYGLLFYPRYHLDQSSLLCRQPLLAKPMVMDFYQEYILVTYRPFDVHIFHVKLFGELTHFTTPNLQVMECLLAFLCNDSNFIEYELSIMTAKSHPAAMRFVPNQLPREGISSNHISNSNPLSKEPASFSTCLIQRVNGELSLLDLDDGRERELTDSIELFWVTCGQSEEKTNLIEEVSWLDYGHRGMQVWYPSLGVDPFKQEDFLQLDPELEFDCEVYPLGLLPNAGVVVGVSQRMSFSASTEFPCFEPTPQAQTILHCLLRHLIQEALRLAQLSAEKPHFSHCLEWLLFIVFDADISGTLINLSCETPVGIPAVLLLSGPIRKRIQYFLVIMRLARPRSWPCYILVIVKLEGPAVSQYCALRLLQATLDESLYELAGELVRFLLRSGREYEQPSTDSDGLSPKILGYFGFCTNFRKQSLDKSTSFKEQNAHVASVTSILESHANFFMSGKELSKLVAFVKGTQFDLVEYLQRERNGSARLENFASGLELIGQKLQMGTLQSRFGAEFLLAYMCSVKFKEWIVVLATLLRRSEVLFDLFQHDMRLWKAYSITLQSHPAFTKYHDLLGDLDERLSSTETFEEK
ncbi:unnamed protein product [Malus baccata var. baccata]